MSPRSLPGPVGLLLCVFLCLAVPDPLRAQIVLVDEGGAAGGTTSIVDRSDDDQDGYGGISLLHAGRLRSPSGLLYAPPTALGPASPPGTLRIRAGASGGILAADGLEAESRSRRYLDRRRGFLLDRLRVSAESSSSTLTAGLLGQHIGREDMSLIAHLRPSRALHLSVFHDRSPLPSMSDARSPHTGIGSETLSLRPGLLPGASSGSQLDQVLAGLGRSELKVERSRVGIDVVARPASLPGWRLSAAYRLGERTGEQPIGTAFFFGFVSPSLGSVIETVKPVEQRTHDLGLELQGRLRGVDLSVGYDFSHFENENARLRWENPFTIGTGAEAGQLALEPSNTAHALRARAARALPLHGRVAAAFSWRTLRQDEPLLPPTIHPALPDWNTTAALSRPSAGARVDHLLARIDASLRPWSPLTLHLSTRYTSRDQRTSYSTANPLLGGQSGYIAEDAGFSLTPQPRTAPAEFDHEIVRLRAGADWRIARRAVLGTDYRHETAHRSDRTRDVTHDDILSISLSHRGAASMVVRGSYRVGWRTGSGHRADPNAALILDAGGVPGQTAAGLRTWDLADRLGHRLELRTSILAGSATDVSLIGGFRQDDYDASLGLQQERAGNVALELLHQPSSRWELRGALAFDAHTRSIDGANATGSQVAAQSLWSVRTRGWQLDLDVGGSLRMLASLRLELDYRFGYGKESLAYDFASAAALSPFGGASPAAAGSGLPDALSQDHVLESAVQWSPGENVSLRLSHQYWESRLDDPRQQGLSTRIDQRLFLGHVDGDFSSHVFLASMRLDL